jgi:hypothetical protein
MTKSENVLANKITDIINNSMSNNIDEKSHNVAAYTRYLSNVTSPILFLLQV